MTDADWRDPENRVFGMLLHGEATDEVDRRGRPVRGDTLLLLLNASEHARRFALPGLDEPGEWRELVDTHGNLVGEAGLEAAHLSAYSLLLLRHGTGRPNGNGGNGS
jgi:glycogen operon protein